MSRNLRALFDPASIAVVGASADPAKWGNAVAVQALRGADRHRIQLVNRRGGEVLGRPTVSTVDDLEGLIDLAVIAVPEAGFEDAVHGVLAKGARAIVAITAGLGESGAEGRAREDALIARIRDAGALLVGPNCLGLVDNTTATYLSSNQFTPGSVAVLSQSGNLAIELDRLFSARGLGISRFVSLGNQADVSLVELIEACAADPATSAIAVYVEDFRDGRGFVEAAAAAVADGTPVVVLAAGASTAAARGAQSHTGSLTSDAAVIAVACAVAGAIQVQTPRQLADVLLALRAKTPSRGPRVAVLTDGGGHGVIACDVAEAAGLDVPALSAATQARLRDALWSQSQVANPVDLAGAGEMDPDSYARAYAVLQALRRGRRDPDDWLLRRLLQRRGRAHRPRPRGVRGGEADRRRRRRQTHRGAVDLPRRPGLPDPGGWRGSGLRRHRGRGRGARRRRSACSNRSGAVVARARRTGSGDRLHCCPKCVRRQRESISSPPARSAPPRNSRPLPMSFGRRTC